MFGDIGHGAVLLLTGVLLCLFDGVIRSKAPSMEGMLQLRYMILLMGLFSTYCGIIYNDFMAIPLWTFDSCYDLKELKEGDEGYHPPKAGEHEPMVAIPK